MRNSDVPTALYVRLAADPAQRLAAAAQESGRSKRQLVEDAVRGHLTEDGLLVGRVSLREPAPEVLTSPEAARFLRVSEAALLQATAAGQLPGRLIGDEWRFSKAAVLAWLESSSDPGSEAGRATRPA